MPKTKKMTVRLPIETLEFLEEVADTSNVPLGTVVSVLLAVSIVKAKQDDANEPR